MEINELFLYATPLATIYTEYERAKEDFFELVEKNIQERMQRAPDFTYEKVRNYVTTNAPQYTDRYKLSYTFYPFPREVDKFGTKYAMQFGFDKGEFSCYVAGKWLNDDKAYDYIKSIYNNILLEKGRMQKDAYDVLTNLTRLRNVFTAREENKLNATQFVSVSYNLMSIFNYTLYLPFRYSDKLHELAKMHATIEYNNKTSVTQFLDELDVCIEMSQTLVKDIDEMIKKML